MRKLNETDKYITQLEKQDLIDMIYSILPEESADTSEVKFKYISSLNEFSITLYRKNNGKVDEENTLLSIYFKGDYEFEGVDLDRRWICNINKMPLTSDKIKRGILKFMIQTFGEEYAYAYLANRSKLIKNTCKKAQNAVRGFYNAVHDYLPNKVIEKDEKAEVRMEVNKETAIEELRNRVEAIVAEIKLEDGFKA